MADMRDNTEFGSDAAIFLHPDGMTESFHWAADSAAGW
jgi:hypothetical protein